MVYCILKSSCDPKPKDFENQYRCCNSCESKKCNNRCTDDCSSCKYKTDKQWVLSQKDRFAPKSKGFSFSQSVKSKKEDNTEALLKLADDRRAAKEAKIRETGIDPMLAKREARRRRREARKKQIIK